MRALFLNAAVFDDQNARGVADGGEPVGNDQCGAALGQRVEGRLNLGLGDGVQGGGGLVQNEDRRVLQEDSGDGDALLLSAGQQRAPLAHVGVKAVGHGQNVVVDLGLAGGVDDLFLGGAGLAVADVFQNGVGKEEDVLLHHADVFPQGLLRHLPNVQPVDGDGAVSHVVEPGNQLAEGSLAAAGGTDNGDGLAGRHVETDVVEDIQVAVVGEVHVVGHDLAPNLGEGLGAGGIPQLRLGAHDLREALQAGQAHGVLLGKVGQLADRGDKGTDIEAEGNEIDVVHLVIHNEPAAHGDDCHRENGEEELHHRGEDTHFLVEGALGDAEAVIGGGELGKLHRLIGKSLGGADTREGGFDFSVDLQIKKENEIFIRNETK